MGDIVIDLSCMPSATHKKDYILETKIIDTGCGISKQRLNMLFEPFLELKLKQNMN